MKRTLCEITKALRHNGITVFLTTVEPTRKCICTSPVSIALEQVYLKDFQKMSKEEEDYFKIRHGMKKAVGISVYVKYFDS